MAVGVSGDVSQNETPPSTKPAALIDFAAAPKTFVFAMVPTVVRDVDEREAVVLVLVAANASGDDGFMSIAYTRSTSRFKISSDSGTCSCTKVFGANSSVDPLIVIIALVTDIPFVMDGAPVLGV